MKNKFKMFTVIGPCIVAVLFILTFVANFQLQISSAFSVITKQTMEMYSTRNLTKLTAVFNKKTDDLSKLSGVMSSLPRDENLENLKIKMHQQVYVGAFSILCYGDSTGHMLSYDSRSFNLNEPAMLTQLMNGNPAISNVRTSVLGGRECISIAVPLFTNGLPSNFLYSEIDLSLLNSNLLQTLNTESNTFAVIQKNGKYISDPKWDNTPNAFDALEKMQILNDVKISTIKKMVRDNAQGQFEAVINNVSYTYDYRPMGINNWFLITRAETGSLNAQKNFADEKSFNLAVEIISVILIAIIVVGLLIFSFVKKLNRKEKDASSMMENMSGGVFEYAMNKKMQFLYVSENFASFLGYTVDEFREKYDNCFSNMIYEYDRERVLDLIREHVKANVTLPLEYRVEKSNGEILWMYDRAKVTHEKTGTRCLVAITDITDIKNMREELKANEECFNLIMEKTNSIILRWNIIDDTVDITEIWDKKFGYHLPPDGFRKEENVAKIVHPEDVKKYIRLCGAIASGKHYGEEVVRFLRDDDSYIWCRLCLTSLAFKNQRPTSAVGVVIDIDRDKRKMAQMQTMAERDGLSTLYNKSATMRIIQDFLLGEGRTYKHALLMFDIDKFKTINDTLGHIYGDAVITDFANILKTAFRSSDVIGRIGGDEFIVFIKNITHLDQVTEKADEINRLVHSTYAGQNNEIQLSTSIGISLFPDDGINYDHLFRTADIALYRSKLVRNTYTVYDFSMRDEAGEKATKTHKTPIDSDNEPVETVAEII